MISAIRCREKDQGKRKEKKDYWMNQNRRAGKWIYQDEDKRKKWRNVKLFVTKRWANRNKKYLITLYFLLL